MSTFSLTPAVQRDLEAPKRPTISARSSLTRMQVPSRPPRDTVDIDLGLTPKALTISHNAVTERPPTRSRLLKSKRRSYADESGQAFSPTSSHASSGMSMTSTRTSKKKALRNVLHRIFGSSPSIAERDTPRTSDDHAIRDSGSDANINRQSDYIPPTHDQLTLLRAHSNRSDVPTGNASSTRAPTPPFPLSNMAMSRMRLQNLRDSQDLVGRRSSLPNRRKLDRIDVTGAFRASKLGPPTADSDIGMAITSNANIPKRRSRSVENLRKRDGSTFPQRQLEDEKAYWRASYAGSIGSRPIQEVWNSPSRESAIGSKHHVDTYRALHAAAPQAAEKEFGGRENLLTVVHNARVSTQHDSNDSSTTERRLQSRVNELERVVASLQPPLEALVKSAKRKSVTFETSDSRRSSHQPMPEDSKLLGIYSILSEERQARKVLERQVQTLQQDLAEMRFSLSQPFLSRSSRVYMPHQARQRYSAGHSREPSNISTYEPMGSRLASRFSRSESLTDSEVARMNRSEIDDQQSIHDGDAETAVGRSSSTARHEGEPQRESADLDMF